MNVFRPARRMRIERSILGNPRSGSGNAVEIRKIPVPKLPKEGFEFCDTEHGCISSRNADWKIKANNGGSSFSDLFLNPFDESKMIADQHGRERPVAVTI